MINTINFLKCFASLFDAEFKLDKLNNHIYIGEFIWPEDTQKIKWENNLNLNEIDILINLCEYLKENQLIKTDKILLNPPELINSLIKEGWEKDDALKAIKNLTEIEVKMIDDNEETDSFFIHF